MAGLVRGIQAAGVLSVVSEHLSRSIPVPLRLDISFYDAYNNSSSDHAFDILSRHAARCESLSLTVCQEQSMSHFLHQLQSRTAVLSSLKHLNFGYGPDDISLAVLVRGAKLRTLNALALDLSWSNFRPCNFSSLQELHIFGLRGAPLGRFLECMPSLDSLELGSLTSGFTLDKAATELADSPVRPSNLRHLRIRSDEDCPAEAWRTLCVPHLTSLRIYFAEYPKSSVEEISSCFFRSRTVLQKLNLPAHFDNEEVLDFVRSQPSIDELTLEYYKSRSEGTVSLKDVLSYLTLSQLEDPQNTALVPNLRRLIIEIFYPDYSFQTLPTLARDISEMVKSRASAGDRPPGDAGLQAFHLDFFAQDCVQDLFSEIRVLLAPLVTSGLQLRLDTC
ncbi:hypothetical protein D9757_009055 [Collybiopsis confluens]|uniref:Uncharacterized protein n=1 Tax=Collybiopsis confluens TaxID=2823264 RepID=A0A8H5M500_9AGAR|nr:hypothetical protein D9757_009055 [Collybiopsis confluens]